MAQTFDLTVQNLVFPNFKANNDKSKMNFRLMFEVIYLNENNKPQTALVFLPGEEKYWQWETASRSNGLSHVFNNDSTEGNPGTVSLNVTEKFARDRRRILLTAGTLYEVGVSVIDMPDNNFDTLFRAFVESNLKSILQQGGKTIGGFLPGLGFIINDENSGKISDLVINHFKLRQKILFEGVDESPINNGNFTIAGNGTLQSSGDNRGSYKIHFDCKTIA